jgi:sigma-B regulation protein RsbU (phosphoserine phosphatase)
MSGLGFLLLLLAVTAIARAIVRPIGMLAASSAEIAKGNLDTPLPLVRTKDEIADLSSSFERMRQALKAYIADLTETTAAKERIDSELKIAHSIQMSFLPKRFPPFPDRSEFSLHAVMEPAKAVGGDLYDYCLLGDTHLFFAIGDVSGKGVPAALFMAVTKTLLKGVAEQGTDPAEVLAKVNRELCLDNETMMFVTAICGTLDLRTGELLVSNAGHNPPLLVRNHAGDGAEWFELPAGVLLGVDEDAAYRTARSFLRPGDTLLLYTDGVTEAMDAEQAVYSDDRLLRAAAAGRTSCPEKLIGAVMADVKAHTGGVEQSDDITLLALEFHGAGPPDDGNH